MTTSRKSGTDATTPAPARTRKATATRDPARTRARILKVAIAEFSAKGYSGARTEQIARRAKTNIRMIYHYFGSKDALYVSVLEDVLAQLRHEELQLDFDALAPLEGLLRMFEFIDGHFEAHPELRNLLAFENLNGAQHLKRSTTIREMASPVIALVERLLKRGAKEGSLRAGIDALHLYVAMVSLAYYGRSHAPTLSRIFATDLLASGWQAAHRAQTRRMLTGFLTAPPESVAPRRAPPSVARAHAKVAA